MSEFARPVRTDQLGAAPYRFEAEANAAERAALAARFGLVALDALHLTAALTRDGAVVEAIGTIDARVVQACVATGDDVRGSVHAPFALRFVPEADAADEGAEIELDEHALDTLPYERGTVDMGEAAAQTLALSLDPWPRTPDADTRLRAAGVLEEGEAGPFAALKGLLGKG